MRVVVALDGSESALVGLEYVACLPLTAADEVILVSVAEVDPAHLRRLRREHTRNLDRLLSQAWTAKRAVARRTTELGEAQLGGWDTPVSQVVRSGHPVTEIATLVDEVAADLLIVGPRGRGRFAAILLGSVTQSLLGVAACPVLVARPPAVPPSRVVLAVDGSPASAAATRAVSDFPLASDPTITIVTIVATWSSPYAELPIVGRPDLLAAEEAAAARSIAASAAEALAGAGLNTTVVVRCGDPADGIVRVARECDADLVVVGALGQSAIRDRLLGSVAGRVASAAPCSVLVAPRPLQKGRRP